MKLTPTMVTENRDLVHNITTHRAHFTVEGWEGVGSALYSDHGMWPVSWFSTVGDLIDMAGEDHDDRTRAIAEAGRKVIAEQYGEVTR